jgi:hypothetical protein
VADIFFSYSRKDKERVGLVRNALAEIGFEVFWDQETPSGSDWDTWIRAELAKSKCAVVFWSASAVASDNVRHEAVVAKEQRKLISVVLDHLPAQNLPMGFYSQQAADLSQWSGDKEDTEWGKFRREFEAKLMPRWVQQKLNDVDAELEGERAKRETSEAHEKTLRAQISKEAKIQQGLKEGRDSALAEVAELKDAFQAQIAKQADTEQGLKTERDCAFAEVAELKATVERLSRARPAAETRWANEPMKRWLAPIAVGIVLLAAILGGTLVSLWQGRKADGGAEAEVAGLTATVNKFDKARQDAEANAAQTAAQLVKSEQARQAAEAKAADAEKARQAIQAKADDADKARLAAFARAEDADRARRAAEVTAADTDNARQAAVARADAAYRAQQVAEAKAAQVIAAPAATDPRRTVGAGPATTVTNLFLSKPKMEARGKSTSPFSYTTGVASAAVCEQNCAQSNGCNVFTYNKDKGWCFMYSSADLVANEDYDSGIRK